MNQPDSKATELSGSSPVQKPRTSLLLLARLADRRKWPRKWWWPLPEELHLSAEDWKKQHDEISNAINRLLLVLIGFSFFCALSLGVPDRLLFDSGLKIAVPFAHVEISFAYFLIVGPLVLAALSFYLHIFAGHWMNLSNQRPVPAQSSPELSTPGLPFVFNLKYRTANWLSYFLFYWLVPVMLGLFAWKGAPWPQGPALFALTSVFIAVFIFLQLRRRLIPRHKIFSFILWSALFCSVFVSALALLNGRLAVRLVNRPLDLREVDLRRQDLRFFNLRKANLAKANLGGANLEQADLTDADLTGANLAEADLTFANLAGAILRDANLTNADLAGAILTKASLAGAILMKASLAGANLAEADLAFANLAGANLTNALLAGADLRGVQGLNQQQIDTAVGDQRTELPSGITKPKFWIRTP